MTKEKEENTGTGNETDDGRWRRGGKISYHRTFVFIKLNAERICVCLYFTTAVVILMFMKTCVVI